MFKNRGVLYKNSNVVEIIVSIDKIPVPKKLSEDQEVLLSWSFFVLPIHPINSKENNISFLLFIKNQVLKKPFFE